MFECISLHEIIWMSFLFVQWVLSHTTHRRREKMVTLKTYLNQFSSVKMLYFDSISLKFVHKVPVNNNPAFFKIIYWCRAGDESLSEPMMARFKGE